MDEPIENHYFNWLCAKVLQSSGNMHVDLLRGLHETPYTWLVQGDKNRAEDGCELRYDFLRETRLPREHNWLVQPCSVLEMLVAFAYRAEFQTDIPARDWFWTFMTNLDLEKYRRVTRSDGPVIEHILNTFIWRTYDSSGHGGLFPMRSTVNDQREVECWYQFCEWLDHEGLI